MTAHVHDPSAHDDGRRPGPAATGGAAMASARPRWLVPALAVGIIAAALVVAGVLSLSTVLYAGLFGGMILMHLGGHGGHGGGHAGHGGGQGGRHDGHGGGTASDPNDLRRPSSDSQPLASGSSGGLDDRASIHGTGSEIDEHDQHSAHGCH